MLFNSIEFFIFLPVVFFIYWFIVNKDLRLQNILLLVSSYFFYANWDYRFLFLLMFSTFLDYYSGIKIEESNNDKIKKFWFWLTILVNLGFLGVFKYYDFFVTSFADGLYRLGFQINLSTLNIIIPVGISFYTFHGLSYIIDIYNGKIRAEKNVVDYAVFVSFFPLLVAGPIERATHLLPQIQKIRVFRRSQAVDGLKQILWGLFKKVVIADNAADFANIIFNDSSNYSGSTLLLGALFFTFQIYCDFSGYSDIALGTARLFGIELLKNFAFPYFSRDIAEFWRRWHISLSSWFRDYLYIPLGGSKGTMLIKIRNVFIIFLVSGFWHGANWTFIIWGGLNAIYFLPSLVLGKNRSNLDIVAKSRYFPTFRELFSMATTFSLTVFAWIFFRAENVSHAFLFIRDMFTVDLFKIPYFPGIGLSISTMILIIIFMLFEWFGRQSNYAIEHFMNPWKRSIRWTVYGLVLLCVFLFNGQEQAFIYFQF